MLSAFKAANSYALLRSIVHQPPICGSKQVNSIQEALAEIKSGSSIAIGGYGPCGVPQALINELANKNTKNHVVFISTAGGENYGITPLFKNKQITKLITSDFEDNKELLNQYHKGEIELHATPLGILAEKLRNGGLGIPAFFSPIGVGTMREEGGVPVKLSKDGKNIEKVSDGREKREFHGKEYIMEKSILADYSFIKGWKADKKGNVVFRNAGMNFNADVAFAGKVCIAEVDEIVEAGALDADDINLPGIYVHKVVKSSEA